MKTLGLKFKFSTVICPRKLPRLKIFRRRQRVPMISPKVGYSQSLSIGNEGHSVPSHIETGESKKMSLTSGSVF